LIKSDEKGVKWDTRTETAKKDGNDDDDGEGMMRSEAAVVCNYFSWFGRSVVMVELGLC
jgi:hypothetical protein